MANNNPLGYPNDVGVDDFTVSLDYRTENRINLAGPAPNAVYGPGNWVTVLKAVLTGPAGVEIPYSTSFPYGIEVSVGTRAVNQDLPGSITGHLDVYPLSIKVTNNGSASASPLQFNGVKVIFALQNPSACVFNPKNLVTNLTYLYVGGTTNVKATGGTETQTTPQYQFISYPPAGQLTNPITVTPLTPSAVTDLQSKSSTNLNLPLLSVVSSKFPTVYQLTIPSQAWGEATAAGGVPIVLYPIAGGQTGATPGLPFIINLNLQGDYIGDASSFTSTT